MFLKKFLLITHLCLLAFISTAQPSVNGFYPWITGRDSATIQYIPSADNNALTKEKNRTVVHVKFNVVKYGEVSFPIKAVPVGTEAPSVDLSKSRYIKICYRSNIKIILQLRQTGIHGGFHNHVVLPASSSFSTKTVYFSSFKGGLKPLDLSDVAKFNLALLENNSSDDYAELTIQSVKIDHYNPNW